MRTFICTSCRASRRTLSHCSLRPSRYYHPGEKPPTAASKTLDIDALLAEPTWSVRDELIPNTDHPGVNSVPGQTDEMNPERLRHMLRLSSLPYPKTPEEEKKMLEDVSLQLYFVRKVRDVDTEGIEPLQSIRDETEQGRKEATIGLEKLREALGKEEIKGRSRRPRRPRDVVDTTGVEDWDVLGTASEKVETSGGKYFVVRSGKDKESNNGIPSKT